MAVIPYFVLGPTAILSILGLIHGPDETIPTPAEDWHKAVVDVIIPAYNEEKYITLCLASLSRQTYKCARIVLVDDNSSDKTVYFAAKFAQELGLRLDIVKQEQNQGKTMALQYGVDSTEADVIFVLDADTVLDSDTFIERTVQELYQGVGIASACGTIRSLSPIEYKKMLRKYPNMKSFHERNSGACYPLYKKNFLLRLSRALTNIYRDVLYSFIQRFVYHSEMVWFGTVINPVGCAVAYRRKYLKYVLEKFGKPIDYNLTTSEDIFIGFALNYLGFRNIQLKDVCMLSKEPLLQLLPKQVFWWSSSFLQSCYYFVSLINTPFKVIKLIIKRIHAMKYAKTIEQKRKIKEAYRQSFDKLYTAKYGRPIGWYIFTSAFEKITFPILMIIFIILGYWEAVFVTVVVESIFVSTVYAVLSRYGNRVINFLKCLMITPIRYFSVFYEIYVVIYFLFDFLIRGNRKWRK